VIYRVSPGKQELIEWSWGVDGPHGQLAQRGKTPESGKMEYGLPLLIRETMLIKITGRCSHASITSSQKGAV